MDCRRKAQISRAILVLSTVVTGSMALVIFLFLFRFSLPLFSSGSLGKFLSKNWDPDAGAFGVYSMIAGSACIASLAMVLAAPLGVGLAVFMELYAGSRFSRFLRYFVELMSGIPTVVYGFSALFILVPLVRNTFRYGSGFCVLSASLVLALLVIPTVSLITMDRIREVPRDFVLAAGSLGASRLETLLRVQLPYAWRGVISAVVLGGGRALGDTIIALMLAGNAVSVPSSLLDSARTLTAHIALVSAADYESLSFKAIFLCGLVLFLFSMFSIVFLRVVERLKE